MSGDQAISDMPPDFRRKNVISCTVEELRVKHHAYKRVQFSDFINALLRSPIVPKAKWMAVNISKEKLVFESEQCKPITTARFFEKINSILDDNSLVVADIGNALFGASELMVHHNHAFLGHALYSVMGGAIPGALGVNMARQSSRPFVFVGDGSFQQSMNELGTIVANHLKPIVFVLNNHGYATERLKYKMDFNNIPNWKYHRVVDMLGGESAEVRNEGELETAIVQALKCDTLFVINVNLEADDNAPLLKSMSIKKN
jgi:TPP-dependent 2-oxoacid decarboxylase